MSTSIVLAVQRPSLAGDAFSQSSLSLLIANKKFTSSEFKVVKSTQAEESLETIDRFVVS